MGLYRVETNRVGIAADGWWKGCVAYRLKEVEEAYLKGDDLECICTDEHPKRMVIPNREIFVKLKHHGQFVRNRPFFRDKRYGTYTLSYYKWLPNWDGNQPIKIAKQLTLEL